MKLSKLALVAAIACGTYAGNVFADQTNDIQLVSCESDCDCGEPVCGCEPACDDACDAGCDSGCDSAGCGLGLGDCGIGSCLDCGDCCLGDPYTLFGECHGITAGGWMQLGYFTNPTINFNKYSDKAQLQQGWLFAEKAIDSSCGFDIGGRIDYVYGTDGPDTQAFGNPDGTYDFQDGWQNGGEYGSALPQLYLEAGYGDLSVKVGHFYTIIGYEVVQATGNFFYSHANTMYNSEPFTHTGILATLEHSDDVTLYGGYVQGYDSGFEDNGDAFLGGVSLGLTERLDVTYAAIGGRLNDAGNGNPVFTENENGYMHSVVASYDVSCDVQYIMQSDYLDTNLRESIGINNYLIKTINDCTGVGARFEWWNTTPTVGGPSFDTYNLTLGVNHRQCANLTWRPEIRYDWYDGLLDSDSNVIEDSFKFAVDAVMTF